MEELSHAAAGESVSFKTWYMYMYLTDLVDYLLVMGGSSGTTSVDCLLFEFCVCVVFPQFIAFVELVDKERKWKYMSKIQEINNQSMW